MSDVSPPCSSCTGVCCKQSGGHKYAVMLVDGEEDNFKHEWRDEDGDPVDTGVPPFSPVIVYENGKCPYLGSHNQCTIYERRPTLCREFTCLSGYRVHGDEGHGFFLEDHPEVVELIELTIRNRGGL